MRRKKKKKIKSLKFCYTLLDLSHLPFPLLRSIYSLVLGENNAADQARAMQESMSMQVAADRTSQL